MMFKKIGLVVASAVMATPAFAVIDVSGATAAIGEGTAAATAIGVAALSVLGVAVVFKLIRRAM